MDLSFGPEISLIFNHYNLQYATLKRALENLSNQENGSWVFRFDYTNSMYFLTIKNNIDEYVNHHVYYYNKNTDAVIIKTGERSSEVYATLEEYIIDMQRIYRFDLLKQIII